MKSNRWIRLTILVLSIVIIGVVIFVVMLKNGEDNKTDDLNNKTEISSEEINSIKEEVQENQNYNDYKIQINKMEEKIDQINANEISGNIPNDLILGINGQNISYDYNWSYNGFKEKYNKENIFEEGKSDYYLLYSNEELNYKIDFKLFPSVDNSVSKVGMGVSNIKLSRKSNNTNKDWSVAGIYLNDDLTTVLNIFGNDDLAVIRESGEVVNGITCVWSKVWLGNKYANITVEFDTEFKAESISVSTIIYNTQNIDKYKSESDHVSK